ncbi:MAG TPA: amidohydrolase family protein [Trebonia sp.]
MFPERPAGPEPVLPFVAAQPLVDHHCHGVLRAGGDLAELLNEADGAAVADGLPFDSLAGLAFRRWCPPLLGLEPHADIGAYRERRAALGGDEVNRRFLGASGLAALCVDTGYTPADLLPPAPTAAAAGAEAFEIVRLEQVAETLARSGVRPAEFPGAYRAALGERVARPASGVRVAGFKSIAAYRVGLALDGRRPDDGEAAAAAARWLGGGDRNDGALPRLADEVLHRFFIWCGADLGLPIQFHVGYGDRDIDLHRCNPLLLTGLLRALEPTGTPVMLLHNYPYHREAGYLAQVFPLVYADLGLATHNVGARATALLGEALELVPLRKFLFSSDAFGLPELYYLGTALFRRALSSFLTAQLAAGDMSYPDAERVTRLIGAENARRAYRLPG